MQGARYKNLQQNMSISNASSAKLMIDDEGDIFRFQSQNRKTHEGDPSDRKSKNLYLTNASFAKLMVEGEGDAFRFKSQSCMTVTHQTENQRPVSSPKLGKPN
jgi:hypothetical protein